MKSEAGNGERKWEILASDLDELPAGVTRVQAAGRRGSSAPYVLCAALCTSGVQSVLQRACLLLRKSLGIFSSRFTFSHSSDFNTIILDQLGGKRTRAEVRCGGLVGSASAVGTVSRTRPPRTRFSAWEALLGVGSAPRGPARACSAAHCFCPASHSFCTCLPPLLLLN